MNQVGTPGDPGDAEPMDVDRVAERLGVKKETVYAYVSRGLLTSRRSPDGRSSVFDAGQVERLAGRRGSVRPGAGSGLTIETSLTLIEGQRLFYRGRDVSELARTRSFEAVAELLWGGGLPDDDAAAPMRCTEQVADVVEIVVSALPESARAMDRMRIGVAAASAIDPFRVDRRPSGVATTAAGLIGAMVSALAAGSRASGHDGAGGVDRGDGPDALAGRLYAGLRGQAATGGVERVVNGALVLLADHELAASTVAARVAASTGADPYAVVLAALGAIDGPRHGLASQPPYDLFVEVSDGAEVAGALARRLRDADQPPGFGHFLYPDGDPRATTLLDLLAGADVDPSRLALVENVRSVAAARSWWPNVDFALAALAYVTGMSDDAGEAIFAVGRTAGWLAHAVEEYHVPFGRFRPRGRYTGPAPRTGPEHG